MREAQAAGNLFAHFKAKIVHLGVTTVSHVYFLASELSGFAPGMPPAMESKDLTTDTQELLGDSLRS